MDWVVVIVNSLEIDPGSSGKIWENNEIMGFWWNDPQGISSTGFFVTVIEKGSFLGLNIQKRHFFLLSCANL